MKKGSSFEKGALILVVTGLIAKTLGALYRIPLTNIIGVEGIGMYQMIIPTLLLALAVSSNYIPATISKCTAYLSILDEEKESSKIFITAKKFVLFITFLICIILILSSKKIALLQHNFSLYVCYILLTPTIILSGIKNVYRGWFFGKKEMFLPSIGQLLEQIAKIGASLVLAYIGIKNNNLQNAVYGATIGLIAGEIVGYGFLVIAKLVKFKGQKIGNYNHRLFYKLIMQESYPVAISGIVFPVVSFLDSFLIVNLLVLSGVSSENASIQYGLLQGPVYSLIHVPIMVATSFSLAIIPMLSSLYSKNDTKSIKIKSSTSIKMCLFMVIPAAVGLVIIAKPLLEILYPRISIENINFASNLLLYSGINIVLLSLIEIFTSIMQGLNESKFAARCIIISTLTKILAEIIFIKIMGIYGAIISNITMYLIASSILFFKYCQLTGKDVRLIQNVGKIVLCSGIMALVVTVCISKIYNNLAVLLSALSIGIVVYLLLIATFRVFSEEELKVIPFGKALLKIQNGVGYDKSNRTWKRK